MRQVMKVKFNPQGVLKIVIAKEMAHAMELVTGDRVMVEVVNSPGGLWKHITITKESK